MAIPVPEDLKPRGSVRSAPPRRPGSVRRTATMDFTWPDGMAGNTVLDGRARDLRTDNDGNATVLAQASLGVVSDPSRIITEISSAPGLPALAGLAGESAMSGFRRRLASLAGATRKSPGRRCTSCWTTSPVRRWFPAPPGSGGTTWTTTGYSRRTSASA